MVLLANRKSSGNIVRLTSGNIVNSFRDPPAGKIIGRSSDSLVFGNLRRSSANFVSPPAFVSFEDSYWNCARSFAMVSL